MMTTTELLLVTIPPSHPEFLGKIQTPSGKTLYKVTNDQRQQIFHIIPFQPNPSRLVIQGRKIWYLSLAKSMGLTFDDRKYDISEKGRPLARIKPEISTKEDNYYMTYLEAAEENEETKTILLGIGLLFALTKAQYELGNLLRESVQKKQSQENNVVQ